MVLRNTTQVAIVLDLDVSRYGIEVALLSLLKDLVPVLLGVPLDRLDPKLPGTIEASVLLHAVGVSPVVHPNRLKVSQLAMLLQSGQASRTLEVQEELHMRRALSTLLQLPHHVGGLGLRVPQRQVLLRVHLRIVQRSQPVPLSHLIIICHVVTPRLYNTKSAT